jgi:hypothetical protein
MTLIGLVFLVLRVCSSSTYVAYPILPAGQSPCSPSAQRIPGVAVSAVVVPAYNEQTIRRTIESLRARLSCAAPDPGPL